MIIMAMLYAANKREVNKLVKEITNLVGWEPSVLKDGISYRITVDNVSQQGLMEALEDPHAKR